MLKTVIDYFTAALILIFVQNLIFTGGFGLCELLRVAAKPKKLFMFCALLTGFATAGSAVSYLISKQFNFSDIENNVRMLLFIVSIAVLYIICIMVIYFYKPRNLKKLYKTVSLAAFNSAVTVVPFFNYKQNNNFTDSVFLGLTAGVGFFFAALLVQSGLKRLNHPDIPKAFSGLGAAFVYIGILSLIFLGINGQLFFVF